MKVIKQGNVSHEFVGKCAVCGAIVKAMHSEVSQLVNSWEYDAEGRCPECSWLIGFHSIGSKDGVALMKEAELESGRV